MMSDSIKELAAALAKVQASIQPASRNATNPHFKSKYADLGAVWDACRKPLWPGIGERCMDADLIPLIPVTYLERVRELVEKFERALERDPESIHARACLAGWRDGGPS
jgi:hypothetical protein